MTSVHVVGIGLDGAKGLTETVRQIVERATLLIGSDRHLSYFPEHSAERLVLGDIKQAIKGIRRQVEAWGALDRENSGDKEIGGNPFAPTPHPPCIVVLVTGDPLFFGLGRMLLAELPPEQLTFHPHLSCVQLAFNRVKVPWHDARVISGHGRPLDALLEALRQGCDKIAVLTDGTNTPVAIARLLLSMDLPTCYEFWVCENLGGSNERIQSWSVLETRTLVSLKQQTWAPLNVVVLVGRSRDKGSGLNLQSLPLLGLPDETFLSYSDRPGLITKREVRILVLGELRLQPGQTIWDVGAGTGSVSIEIGRLFPSSAVYAVEKTLAGTGLIEQNCQRFQVRNVISINGEAPSILERLPVPHRIFIGGTGGNLRQILSVCGARLATGGAIVLALATLEHLADALAWVSARGWHSRLLQVQLSRSVPIGQLTRFSPLNPVTILTITHSES